MRSETLGEEFARLVREYRPGDGQVAAEAWNLIADFAVENAEAIGAALSADVVPPTTATDVIQITDDTVRDALSAEEEGSFYSDFARMRAALMASFCASSIHVDAQVSKAGPDAAANSLQARVRPWLMACFGPEISADKLERGDRLLEEVFELLQSGDYPRERIRALEDYTYTREKGDPEQEVGGVMITLAAYCLAHGLDMHEAGETELVRIWTKVEKIRAKQASKPTGSALPIAVGSASARLQDVAESKPLDLDVTQEWLEKRAALEGDHEIGAGSRIPTVPVVSITDGQADVFTTDRPVPDGWQPPSFGALSADLEPTETVPDILAKELLQQRRMIVSHATMGRTDGEGQSVNDICVTITKLRNELYEEAQKTAPPASMSGALRDAVSKLLDQAEHVCIGAHTPFDVKEAAKNLADPIKSVHAALSEQARDEAGGVRFNPDGTYEFID